MQLIIILIILLCIANIIGIFFGIIITILFYKTNILNKYNIIKKIHEIINQKNESNYDWYKPNMSIESIYKILSNNKFIVIDYQCDFNDNNKNIKYTLFIKKNNKMIIHNIIYKNLRYKLENDFISFNNLFELVQYYNCW
jgi:hypothetical protein